MSKRKYQKTYKVWYYPDSPKDEDGVHLDDVLEIWGNYIAPDKQAAIEAALSERYPHEHDNVIPITSRPGDRSKAADKPHVFARLDSPRFPFSTEEPMKSKHQAEQEFYKAIGEISERVVGNTDGLFLDGPFTSAELRLVADAFDNYQETLKALESK